MNRRGLRWKLGLASAIAVTSAVTGPVAAQAQGTAPARIALAAELRDDFNGDGYSDVAFPAPSGTVGGKAQAGYVAVMYGSSTGLKTSTKQVFHQDSAGIPGVAEAGDAYGSSVTTGDLDGDGYADLVVGASGEDVGTISNSGSLAVVWGGAKGLSGSGSATLAVGDEAHDRLGWTVRAGDFDADGAIDVVGVENYLNLRVLSGPFGRDGSSRSTASITDMEDMRLLDLAAGDINGDGVTDLVAVVNSLDEYDWRHIRYWTGTKTGLTGPASVKRANGFRLEGGERLDVGDVNNDGIDDIVVGRALDGYDSDLGIPTANGGMITYVPGSNNGPVGTRAKVFNQDSAGIPGVAENNDAFGEFIQVADINGDGYADVSVGVPGEDFDGRNQAGAVVTLRGTAAGLTGTGARSYSQNTAGVPGTAENNDGFGAAGKLVDTNGDGRAELVVGAPGENADAGSVWVFKSNSSGVTPTGSFTFGAGTLGTVATGALLGSTFNY
ncbi:FG-GAP-like repeat-containing protein [Streptomyces sp. NPDC006208]|uniref:FG-GAP-like repeat-containing protein n=1 Tax=Streptomyces sp. NPDC006208 TaxID=3156734 RepID=UPI0033AB0991